MSGRTGVDGRRRGRIAGPVIGVLVALAALGGCGSSSDSSGSAAAPMAPAEQMAPDGRNAAADSAGGPGADTGAKSGAGAAEGPAEAGRIDQPGVDRKLVRTASMTLDTETIAETSVRARDIVTAAGGFAGQEQVNNATASLTLHVPVDKLDKVVGELSGLGEVMSRSQSAEDVTEQVVDVDSRVASQRASVERVRALLGRATTIGEITQIESELTRRESELDSLLKRQERLAGSVALATVTMHLQLPGAAPIDEASFLDSLAAGWHALVVTVGVILRVLGALLPFAVVLVPLAWLAVRWTRKRARTRPAQPMYPMNPVSPPMPEATS